MKPVIHRILAIDDDKSFLDMVKNFFASYGIEVACAHQSQDGLELMRTGKFPVVILDYKMPLLNGDDLIALLQSINPHAKFIVVSGILEEDVEGKFRGLGYYAFFEKGKMQLSDLIESVKSALHSG